MPLQQIAAVGTKGIIKDTEAVLLPNEAWTDGRNVRFNNGSVEKITGHQSVFTMSVEADFLINWPRPSAPYYIYGNAQNLYRVDGAGSEASIVPSGTTFEANGRWHASLFNGGYTVVFNNTLESPQYMQYGTAGNAQETLMQQLPSWPANTTCAVLRPFKNALIAGNLTDSSGDTVQYQPGSIRVSSLAAPGNVPNSWTIGIGTNTADEFELSQTQPIYEIVDLRGQCLIFTGDSIHRLTLASGNNPTVVNNLNYGYGVLTTNCTAIVENQILAVDRNDIYLTNGAGSINTVADGRVRDYFFKNLSDEYYERTFLVNNIAADEAWLCYPKDSDNVDYCTEALIWNYRDNTWSIRDLQNTRGATVGPTTDGTDFSNIKEALFFTGFNQAEADGLQRATASGTDVNETVEGSPGSWKWTLSGNSATEADAVTEVASITVSGDLGVDVAGVTEVQTLTPSGSRSNIVDASTQEMMTVTIDDRFVGGVTSDQLEAAVAYPASEIALYGPGEGITFDIDLSDFNWQVLRTTTVVGVGFPTFDNETDTTSTSAFNGNFLTSTEGWVAPGASASLEDVIDALVTAAGDGVAKAIGTLDSIDLTITKVSATTAKFRVINNDATLWCGQTSLTNILFSNDSLSFLLPKPATYQIIATPKNNASFAFDPDVDDTVYSTEVAATDLSDNNATATQFLTQLGTAAAALDTDITWNGTVSNSTILVDGVSQTARAITIDLGTLTNIAPMLTLTTNGATFATFTVVSQDPFVDSNPASTYTVSDYAGTEVSVFTSSVTTASQTDRPTIVSAIVKAVNDNEETPIDFSAVSSGFFLVSFVTLTADEDGAVTGSWSVDVNHNNAPANKIGDYTVTSATSTEGVTQTFESQSLTINYSGWGNSSAYSNHFLGTIGGSSTLTAAEVRADILAKLNLFKAEDSAVTATFTLDSVNNKIVVTAGEAGALTPTFRLLDPNSEGLITYGTQVTDTEGLDAQAKTVLTITLADDTEVLSITLDDASGADTVGQDLIDETSIGASLAYDAPTDTVTLTALADGSQSRPTITLADNDDLTFTDVGADESGTDLADEETIFTITFPDAFTPSTITVNASDMTRAEALAAIRDAINLETFTPADIVASSTPSTLTISWVGLSVGADNLFSVAVDNQGGDGDINFGDAVNIDEVSTSEEIHQADVGFTFNGANIPAHVERSNMNLGQEETTKWTGEVFPLLSGDESVNITFGGNDSAGDVFSFAGADPVSFEIDGGYKVSNRSNGRFFNIRFETNNSLNWTLAGYSISVERGDRL